MTKIELYELLNLSEAQKEEFDKHEEQILIDTAEDIYLTVLFGKVNISTGIRLVSDTPILYLIIDADMDSMGINYTKGISLTETEYWEHVKNNRS